MTEKPINLVTKENIEKCLKYIQESEDQHIFNNMIKETQITAKYLDTDRYFPEDKEYRDIYTITIKRNNEKIRFKFGASMVMTYDHIVPDLYDILAGIDLEYKTANQSFTDFCDEIGFNSDSIKDKKTYDRCVIQSKKLQKIFTESESYAMPI